MSSGTGRARSGTDATARPRPRALARLGETLRAVRPADPLLIPAFAAESTARAARGAQTFGSLALAMLMAGAAVSFLTDEPHALRLLDVRLAGGAAIAGALYLLRRSDRHGRACALAITLVLAATIETLALWTGGPTSLQHDRLNLVILGAGFLVPWSPAWVLLSAAGMAAIFVASALPTQGLHPLPVTIAQLGYFAVSSAAAVAICALRERRRLADFEVRIAREEAQRRLVQQEERYRSVVETAGSAIVVLDLDHRIREFNAEAERLSGWRREAVLGCDYVELFVPEPARASVRDVIRRLVAGEPVESVGVMLCADGSRRYVRWRNCCLRDADGRIVAILGAGQDVTESRRAERALRESEARLRRLVESVRAIPWEAEGEDFGVVWIGPQAAALGYPLEAWREPHFWVNHVHPDDRERTFRLSREWAQRMDEFDMEYRLVAADGRVVWMHDLVTVDRRDGVAWRMRGFLIDITERKRAEAELEARVLARTAELRESEARLRSILQASPLGGGIIEDDGAIDGPNPALYTLLGRPAGTPLTLTGIVHRDDRARMLAALRELRHGEADVRRVDARYVRHDGAAVWAHTALVATGSQPEPRRIFTIIEDVTARKREEALVEGERRALRLLAQNGGLEAALDALLECLEANDAEMVSSILVADEHRRLRFGAGPRLGSELAHAFDGIQMDDGRGTCRTHAGTGTPVVFEDIEREAQWTTYRALTAAQGLRACWWQPILSATGQLLGTFALYSRVPNRPSENELALMEAAARAAAVVIERQRLDDLLARHRAELAHAGRLSLLAELAGGLAHEMQQPLASIVNYAGGCERLIRSGAVTLEALLEAQERIRDTALRAGQIIRGIRNLAQKREPRRERIDVNAVARSAVQLIEGEARRHGIFVRYELAPNLPAVVADPIQIEQVVLNLLSNGLEAIGADAPGELTVRSWRRDDGAVAVSVRDTGAGLPDDVAERMFDPFFTTKPLGLGLGLSIGRTIVESHEGAMWAAPAAGGGAVVGFTLPAEGTVEASQGTLRPGSRAPAAAAAPAPAAAVPAARRAGGVR